MKNQILANKIVLGIVWTAIHIILTFGLIVYSITEIISEQLPEVLVVYLICCCVMTLLCFIPVLFLRDWICFAINQTDKNKKAKENE